MTIKEQLFEHCVASIEHRMLVCAQSLRTVQESMGAETKSSAGDKHETGRAMMQLEREKLGGQLAAIEADQLLLSMVDVGERCDTVRLGSVVVTDGGRYYIAVSAGKVNVAGQNYYTISLASPIGQVLAGMGVGARCVFREKEIVVLGIE